MKMLIMLSLLLLAQTASAKVYMCVDHATGKTSFTDKACETAASLVEEVRVDRSNLLSGKKYGADKAGQSRKQKVWNSQRDTRKTARDLTAERGLLYGHDATAQVN
jgi:hypothetical protein